MTAFFKSNKQQQKKQGAHSKEAVLQFYTYLQLCLLGALSLNPKGLTQG